MSPLTFGKASLRRPMVMCQGYPSFARVRPPHPLWRLVQHAFEHRIKPIYGDQSKALTQVERASDRTLEVLHLNKHEAETPSREVETEIAGILLYKDVCTDEFSDYGLRNSLEVKTLCLVPEAPGGRGGGGYLVERALEVAGKAGAETLHLTVNSTAQDNPLEFFKKPKFGFIEKGSWPANGGTEYLLYRPVPNTITHAPASQPDPMHAATASNQSGRKRARDDREHIREPDRQRARRQPRHHRITLKAPYIRAIQRGQKTVEGRINSGMMRDVQQMDTIDFYGKGSAVSVQVTRIGTYHTFREMLQAVGVETVLPEYKSLDDGVRLFQSLPGYQDKERKFGVLAFHIAAV